MQEEGLIQTPKTHKVNVGDLGLSKVERLSLQLLQAKRDNALLRQQLAYLESLRIQDQARASELELDKQAREVLELHLKTDDSTIIGQYQIDLSAGVIVARSQEQDATGSVRRPPEPPATHRQAAANGIYGS